MKRINHRKLSWRKQETYNEQNYGTTWNIKVGSVIGTNQDEQKKERIVLLIQSALDDLGMEQITKIINELYDSDEIPE